MITADNEEIRCIGSDGTVSSLLLSFLDTLTFTDSTKFSSFLVFKTSSSGCSFAITPPTTVSLKLTGDDVKDGVLTPIANKVYEIAFYWNGFFMSGLVRGIVCEVAKKQNKITITNSSHIAQLYAGTEESMHNMRVTEIIAPGQSQEFTLDGNIIYAGFTKDYMTQVWGNPSGCTVTNMSSSPEYDVYKIEITNSPAACSFKNIETI